MPHLPTHLCWLVPTALCYPRPPLPPPSMHAVLAAAGSLALGRGTAGYRRCCWLGAHPECARHAAEQLTSSTSTLAWPSMQGVLPPDYLTAQLLPARRLLASVLRDAFIRTVSTCATACNALLHLLFSSCC